MVTDGHSLATTKPVGYSNKKSKEGVGGRGGGGKKIKIKKRKKEGRGERGGEAIFYRDRKRKKKNFYSGLKRRNKTLLAGQTTYIQ